MIKSILLLLLISINVSAQVPAKTIPEFTFLQKDKSLFTNNNLQTGKKLFIVFFDSECDHCHNAIQYINQHVQEFKKAAIYLITLDSQEKIAGFMAKYAPQLFNENYTTILQDFKNEFILKFKPKKYPSLFLYSKQKS